MNRRLYLVQAKQQGKLNTPIPFWLASISWWLKFWGWK